MHNIANWDSKSAPGGKLPYGLQKLDDEFSLVWTDRHKSGIWTTPPFRQSGHLVKLIAPGFQGMIAATCARRNIRSAEAVLSIFENVGLGLGRLQGVRAGSSLSTPHVMLACWLAEDCQRMSAHQLRSVRRSIESVSKIGVFSANQIAILVDILGINESAISVLPFGIDSAYYDASIINASPGGGGIIAVGSDSRRDYRTLFEAVRVADVSLTIVCYPQNLKGLRIPPKVTVLTRIGTETYRRLLLSADLVVTPTVAPAYPSGQSVVLEAMAMGRATLTTCSSAMGEYVTDGVDGILIPPRDPDALAHRIRALMADQEHRDLLGAHAAETVRKRFTLDHLWRGVSEMLKSAIKFKEGSSLD